MFGLAGLWMVEMPTHRASALEMIILWCGMASGSGELTRKDFSTLC